MENVNMMELNPILFNITIVFQCITGVVGLGLMFLWWRNKIPFAFLFGGVLVLGIVFIAILVLVASANSIPIQEVFKVLFWFNRR